MPSPNLASEVIRHCRTIAAITDVPGEINRTYLSEAAYRCQHYVADYMRRLKMEVRIDSAGNVRGLCAGSDPDSARLLIGSHLDTVPNAGAFDGVLGVVLGLALVESLEGDALPFAIEVIGFSEEEGIRFALPFIGSRALIGHLDAQALNTHDANGVTLEQAIQNFGLNPHSLCDAVLHPSTRAYLEFHIEQGPVLEHLGVSLAVADAIVGQTRAVASFIGKANHAGTTPMRWRQDALCAAAEWILAVEQLARSNPGLVATVGRIAAKPGAPNVIPGDVSVSVDVRHADDAQRVQAFERCLAAARDIAHRRELTFESAVTSEQSAVLMDRRLSALAEKAITDTGLAVHRIASGAGHDAMIVAKQIPCAMIFLRSPGGISHSPDETVFEEDVALALRAGMNLLKELSACHFLF